uniref:F-box domain-containing protein n=1 Tax=Spongospora subterranea TaxID=70186 RepID=A0A0H5R9B4_9EUKA|eukprot:CRZ10361.1 hypothetical protein [Spongospora subterranea]
MEEEQLSKSECRPSPQARRRLSSLSQEPESRIRLELHALISIATLAQLLPILRAHLQHNHPPLMLLVDRLNNPTPRQKICKSTLSTLDIIEWCRQALHRKVASMKGPMRVSMLKLFLYHGVSKYHTGQPDLSNDCWVTVCCFLNVEDLLKMRFVNRQWYERISSRQMWRAIRTTSLKLSTFSESPPSYEELHRHGFGRLCEWISLESVNTLTMIHDENEGVEPRILTSAFSSVLSICSTQLHTLYLKCVPSLDMQDLDLLAERCPLLAHVSVGCDSFCGQRSKNSLTNKILAKYCQLKKLTTVYIRSSEHVDAEGVRSFLRLAPKTLTRFILHQCVFASSPSLSSEFAQIALYSREVLPSLIHMQLFCFLTNEDDVPESPVTNNNERIFGLRSVFVSNLQRHRRHLTQALQQEDSLSSSPLNNNGKENQWDPSMQRLNRQGFYLHLPNPSLGVGLPQG